jgi:hypothetical protein
VKRLEDVEAGDVVIFRSSEIDAVPHETLVLRVLKASIETREGRFLKRTGRRVREHGYTHSYISLPPKNIEDISLEAKAAEARVKVFRAVNGRGTIKSHMFWIDLAKEIDRLQSMERSDA